ncbi:serine/threonine-protein kinase [Spirillospora sp. NPDC047279]|uniref:serine/threonine-protein kinase n=1 Tax=Spirillospora sp. NPDC047279 TaxID=3155478 RepID=UPI0033DE370D
MEPLRSSDPRRVAGYEVLARLGTGGTGEVYLAGSPGGRQVAMKVVHRHLAGDPAVRDGFRRELAAVRSVSGVYTAPFVDADADAERPWLASAYLPGLHLAEAVTAYGPLPPPSVRALGVGLAEALSAIHRAGVVHRDLTPRNVLLSVDGPKVLDFGVARAPGDELADGAGSPGFMAPEQVADGDSGPAGDVFALGAVLVYASAGTGPFGADENHLVLRRTLLAPPWLDGVADPALRAVIAGFLAKAPAERPTADQALERLNALPGPVPSGTVWLPAPLAAGVSARLEAPIPAPVGRISRRTVLLVGGALGAAATATGGVVWGASRFIQDGPDRVLWTYQEAKATPWAGPTVRAGSLFVVPGDRMVALDPVTGRRRWSGAEDVRVGEAPDNTWDRVGGDVAIEAGGRLGHVVARSGSASTATLLTFDVGTGRVIWRREFETSPLRPGTSHHLRAGNAVCLREGVMAGVLALAADTGRQLWRVPGAGALQAAGQTGTGAPMVFAELDSTVRAIDPATGRQVWTTRYSAPNTLVNLRALRVAGDRVLALATDELLVLDARTGKILFRHQASTAGSYQPDALRTGDLLLYGGLAGKLSAFDATTGRSRWAFDLRPARAVVQPVPRPVLAGSAVVLADNDGALVNLELANGRALWRREMNAEQGERPVLLGGLLHLCGKDALYSVDPAEGRVVRRLAEIRDGSDGEVTGGSLLCAMGTTLFFHHRRGEFVAVRA